MKNWKQIIVVLAPDGTATLYGAKVLPATNTKGTRIAYAPVNDEMEATGDACTRQWSYTSNSLRDELQHQLGQGYRALMLWEVLTACALSEIITFNVLLARSGR